MPSPATKTPSIAELTEATERKPGEPAIATGAAPSVEEQNLAALRITYNARRAAMRAAFEVMQGLDDLARQAVFTALGDGSQSPLEQDLATFKLRNVRLLKIPAARAAEVK